MESMSNNKIKSIIGLVISVFHCFIWIGMIVNALQHGGHITGDSGGGVAFLIGFYYIFFGLILTVLSYIFAFKELKTSFKRIAIVTLIAHLITFFEIVIFFAIVSGMLH